MTRKSTEEFGETVLSTSVMCETAPSESSGQFFIKEVIDLFCWGSLVGNHAVAAKLIDALSTTRSLFLGA